MILIFATLLVAFTTADPIADGTPRLVGGPSEAEGKLEVHYQGSWYSVCDGYFDYYAASIVCDHLQIRGHPRVLPNYDDSLDNVYITDVVQCDGTEPDILSCRNNGIDAATVCSAGLHLASAVGIKCDGLLYGLDEVRFTDDVPAGVVEVKYRGEWTTVCGPEGDFFNGMSLCRIGGYGGNGIQNLAASAHAPTSGLYIRCLSGSEASPDQCYVDFEGTCNETNVVAITCNVQFPCFPGSHQGATFSECLLCPQGFYQPLGFQTECLQCPAGTTTRGNGTVFEHGCINEVEVHEEVVYIKEEITERYYDQTRDNLNRFFSCMDVFSDLPEGDDAFELYIREKIDEAVAAGNSPLVDKLNVLLGIEMDLRSKAPKLNRSDGNQREGKKEALFDLYAIRSEL